MGTDPLSAPPTNSPSPGVLESLATDMRADVAQLLQELPDLLQAISAVPDSRPGAETTVTAKLVELWGHVRSARLAVQGAQGALSSTTTNTLQVNQGYEFQSSGYVSENISHLLVFYLHPKVVDLVTDISYSDYSRYMLILSVIRGYGIVDVLVSEFGCSPEVAGQAESLVRQFLKNAHGIELAPERPTALPDKPPHYAYRPRMEGGIEQYLRDNWADYIKAGLLSRPDLKRIDPAAYQALQNWLKKPMNRLPDELSVPTKSQAINKLLETTPNLSDAERLARAKRARERRPTR